MVSIKSFDHVGVTVSDLERATEFFVKVGLEIEGRAPVEGEFVDTVTGIPGSKVEMVMLRPPGGGTAIELSTFLAPDLQPGSPEAVSTEIGIRNVCFEVDDLQPLVDELAADGYGLVGGIGRHEDVWLMAYVRGPDGIIVSLAQHIG